MTQLHPIMQQALAPFLGASFYHHAFKKTAFYQGENMEIETRVSGIPCIAKVTHYSRQEPHRGSAQSCDSDWDYTGFTECEFDILDRSGKPAAWLERKVTDDDRQRIEQEITKHLEN